MFVVGVLQVVYINRLVELIYISSSTVNFCLSIRVFVLYNGSSLKFHDVG